MALHHNPRLVTQGLVLALDAGDVNSYPGTGTTWYDVSGNGYDCSLTNGPVFDSANLGNMAFDGVDDLAQVPGAGISDYSQPFSMGVWFKIDPAATWDNGFRSNIYGIAGSYAGMYGLWKASNDQFGMQLRDADSTQYTVVSGNVKGVWYHLVGTWDGSTTMKLYRNGILVDTNTGGGITGAPDTTQLYIAGVRAYGGAAGNAYQGNIARCDYYNRALSASEIEQNYLAQKSRFGL